MNTLNIEDRNLNENVSSTSSETLIEWATTMDRAIDQSIRFLQTVDERFVVHERVSYRGDENSLVGQISEPSGELIDVSLFIETNESNGAVFFVFSVFEGVNELVVEDESAVENAIQELLPGMITGIFY